MYIFHINIYIYIYIHTHKHTHTHTLQFMATSGIVIQYIGSGYKSPNPQKMHFLKWEFCVKFV